MKLTDTQLVLLSAASQREDGAVVLAPNLKGSASQQSGRQAIARRFDRRSLGRRFAAGVAP